ncbi:hypothetical protein [Mariniblastus fucicola]|uniref:hypothetical protein n=1 Tax=Mariniblastus fucicola TaxID=980251 RepID=UPI0009463893|nr:hypothetical protein [Mariniblastus fucicola]
MKRRRKRKPKPKELSIPERRGLAATILGKLLATLHFDEVRATDDISEISTPVAICNRDETGNQ